MASSSSSSSAELSVKKPGHTSKPPGCRFGREGALSLGANQHECVYARVCARQQGWVCEKQDGMEEMEERVEGEADNRWGRCQKWYVLVGDGKEGGERSRAREARRGECEGRSEEGRMLPECMSEGEWERVGSAAGGGGEREGGKEGERKVEGEQGHAREQRVRERDLGWEWRLQAGGWRWRDAQREKEA